MSVDAGLLFPDYDVGPEFSSFTQIASNYLCREHFCGVGLKTELFWSVDNLATVSCI